MMPSAGPQYEGVLGSKDISGLIDRGTKSLTKGISKGQKIRNQYITGRYRQLRKGAEDFVTAKKVQDLKENIQASTQKFIRTEGEKEFMAENQPLPKPVNTTQQANISSKGPLFEGNKLGAGNLVSRRTGSRRVTAEQRALPTRSGGSLSAAQRRTGFQTSTTKAGTAPIKSNPVAKMSNAEKLRVSNLQQGTPRRVTTKGNTTV